MKYVPAFLFLGVLSAASALPAGDLPSRGVEIASDGNLVWATDGHPAFLLSAATKPTVFAPGGTSWLGKQYKALAADYPDYAWLYGTDNTVGKMTRIGFNALNLFLMPSDIGAILPDDVGTAPFEASYSELLGILGRYGWYNPKRHVNVLNLPQGEWAWKGWVKAVKDVQGVPFYIDLHAAPLTSFFKARNAVSNRLDVAKLLLPQPVRGFCIGFRLTNEEGPDAMSRIYCHSARTYQKLGLKPWAYKLLNEPSYPDETPELRQMLADELRARYGTIEALNADWGAKARSFEAAAAGTGPAACAERLALRERLMTKLCRRLRNDLRAVEPGTPAFVQVHSPAWRLTHTSVDLFAMSREMDIISIGTGGCPLRGVAGESCPPGTRFAEAVDPGEHLLDTLGRLAFYRALGRTKPLVASEVYFPGQSGDRSRHLENTLWHAAADGIAMANLWEWGWPRAQTNSVSFALANVCSVAPATWDVVPRVVRELNELADFFPCGVRRIPTRVACLFSNPTRRFAKERLDGFCSAVAALTLGHFRTDVIFEEELAENPVDRLKDYDVVVVSGVEETLPGTDAALEAWMEKGGRCVVFDAAFNRNEHGRVRPDALITRGHRNLLRLKDDVPVFARAAELRRLLSGWGLKPVADIRDVETGDVAPFVQVVRTENKDGLSGWFLANYSETARLVTVTAEDFTKDVAAYEPFGTTAWPVAEGKMTVVLPARFHALAVVGSPSALAARFGTRTPVATAALKDEVARLLRADLAAQPRRPSQPIDLKAFANGGFDNQQGWSDGSVWEDETGRDLKSVPFHTQTFRHVDFDIIRFDFNLNRTTIALKSASRPEAPAVVGPIPLNGKQLRTLAFLHAATHAHVGDTAYSIDVTYMDGSTVSQEARVGREIGDWNIAANDPSLQSNCVWRAASGKGFFLWEWENPRPTEPIRHLTLRGGTGTSCGNVVAISALPTVFTKAFAHRIDLVKEPFISDAGTCGRKPEQGTAFPLTQEDIRTGVLRLEVAFLEGRNGTPPKFRIIAASAVGVLPDGTRRSTETTTPIGDSFMRQMPRSAATAGEWAEVEIPLPLLARGMDVTGRSVQFASLLSVRLPKAVRLRNVRLEY